MKALFSGYEHLEEAVHYGPMRSLPFSDCQHLHALYAEPLGGHPPVLWHGGIFEPEPPADCREVAWRVQKDPHMHIPETAQVRYLNLRFHVVWFAQAVHGNVYALLLPLLGGNGFHLLRQWELAAWVEAVDAAALDAGLLYATRNVRNPLLVCREIQHLHALRACELLGRLLNTSGERVAQRAKQPPKGLTPAPSSLFDEV